MIPPDASDGGSAALNDVWTQVLRAYGTCETFRCSAQLRRKITADGLLEQRFKMELAFERPQQMYLRWWHDHTRSYAHHTLIARNSIVLRHSWFDAEWKHEESIVDALA